MALRVDDVDLVRDRALVERFQEGDPAAFDTLYTRYFGRLVRFCQKRVGDPYEAEEIAQEAFTRALRALPAFEGERRFYPWMTVIAGRLCVDAHRRRGRSEPSDAVDLGVIEGGQEKIVDAVDIEILRTAMVQLAPRHREVLDLREQQGWSYQQIADHYGVTLGTVEALLFRARKALKREFMAVVGGDRNWAAVPGLGLVLRRVAIWKAKVEAWGAAVAGPFGGPAVAAAVLAVTAVTGAVGAGVLQGGGDSGGRSSAPSVTRLTAVSAAVTTPNALPAGVDAPASSASVTDGAKITPGRTGGTAERAAPLVETDTQGVDAVDLETSETKSKEKPYQADLGPVVFGFDPARAAGDVVQYVTGYSAGVEQ